MRRIIALTLFALSPFAARAQTPEQLLDRFAATGDAALLEQCRDTLRRVQPSHRTRVLNVRLQLALGNATTALAEARAVNHDAPDDLDTYASIVDAALALRMLDEAERAAQWMINLRPEDPRGMISTAAVREAYNDLAGAEAMLVDAYRRTGRTDLQVRAQIATSLGRIAVARGQADGARRFVREAFKSIPEYRPAAALLEDIERHHKEKQ